MSDVFNEVEEELRAERYTTLFKKGWPWVTAILVAALAIALAFWGWDAYSRSQESKVSVDYSHALEALTTGKTADAETGFQTVSKSGPNSYRALALMQLAGLREAAGKIPEAVTLLDKAQSVSPDKLMKDAAALRAGLLLVDTAPLAEIRRRLEPLAAVGRPYRFMAREAIGVSRLAAGRAAEARGDFAVLSLATDASDATRARAKAALASIDSGSAGSIPATIKAAAALPAQPILPPASAGLPLGAPASATP